MKQEFGYILITDLFDKEADIHVIMKKDTKKSLKNARIWLKLSVLGLNK